MSGLQKIDSNVFVLFTAKTPAERSQGYRCRYARMYRLLVLEVPMFDSRLTSRRSYPVSNVFRRKSVKAPT